MYNQFLIYCLVTVIIENSIAYFVFNIKSVINILYITLVNITTNISLNLCLIFVECFLLNNKIEMNYYYVIMFIGEIIVVITEYILYKLYIQGKSRKQLFIMTFGLNFSSWVFGLFLYMVGVL